MKPLDPRLLHYARSTRTYLAASAVLGTVSALLVIGQAWLLATVVARSFQESAGFGALSPLLMWFGVVTVGRAVVAWLTELSAHQASASVKSELRLRLMRRAVELGPGWLTSQRTGELVTLATRGIDGLDGYFARYLPQLVLALTVPASVLVVVFSADWLSAAIILVTLPLIPVFMALIGMATARRVERERWALDRLAGYFLDVVAGLPTLKVFGRAKAQATAIRAITGDYRRATLRTLRLAFVSSFALELLSTISVALVAVGIGLRLVDGTLDLRTGLLVLILAPEAYLPLRQVGAHFHASAEGVAAAGRVFEVLETSGGVADGSAVEAGDGVVGGAVGVAGISVRDLTVRFEGRSEAALDGFSLEVRPGECVAVVGASGAGKSTLLNVLLGFVAPTSGSATVRVGVGGGAGVGVGVGVDGGADGGGGSPDVGGGGLSAGAVGSSGRRDAIAWVPQRPYLFATTIGENVRLARPSASDEEVWAALYEANAADFVRRLPAGLATVLGEDGAGLSAGQRQRVGLARAFLADRPIVLLDEPTANLDGASEASVVEGVRRLIAGRTAIVVAHRPALLGVADRVVRIGLREATDESTREPGHRLRTQNQQHIDVAAGTYGPPDLGDNHPKRVAASISTRCQASTLKVAPDEGNHQTGSSACRPGESHSPLRRLLTLAKPARARLILATALAAAALGSAVGLMATSAWLISRASQQPPILYLMVAMTAVRALGLGRAAFRYAERLVSHDAAFRVLAGLRVRVYERLVANGFDLRRGDLLSRMVADVDAVQDFYLRFLIPSATAATVGLATSVALALALPAAGLALAVGLILTGVAVPWLTAKASAQAERRIAPAKGDLSTQAIDLLRGAPDLIAANAADAKLAELQARDQVLESSERRSAAAAGVGAALSVFVTGATVWICAAVGIQAVHAGTMNGLLLAVVVLTPLAAFEATVGMPTAAQYLHRSRAAAQRVFAITDAPDPVEDPHDPEAFPAGPYTLQVRGLKARWPGQSADTLHGVDLDLAPGQRIAVVGPSGSGKTTLINTLLRFLDPEEGSIALNGTDTTHLRADDVRRVIGLCAQDAHIFDSTVRENLRLARPEATEQELCDALDAAKLKDWVDTLPRGLDTFVGEHGAQLSGGQRQRLALARTLLADFPVLLLDEPTEHLDLETADALTRDLLEVTERRRQAGRSTLIVTHRLAGLEAVDEILVLVDGKVVQRGTWDELQSAEGLFRELSMQEERTEAMVA